MNLFADENFEINIQDTVPDQNLERELKSELDLDL